MPDRSVRRLADAISGEEGQIAMKYLLLCALLCPIVAGADVFDNAVKVCRAIEHTGMSTECTTSGYHQAVDVRFNTNAAEAQKICPGIVDVIAQGGLSFASKWKLRIFSPYSGDHPIAVCTLK
jgi:hypothetical protein